MLPERLGGGRVAAFYAVTQRVTEPSDDMAVLAADRGPTGRMPHGKPRRSAPHIFRRRGTVPAQPADISSRGHEGSISKRNGRDLKDPTPRRTIMADSPGAQPLHNFLTNSTGRTALGGLDQYSRGGYKTAFVLHQGALNQGPECNTGRSSVKLLRLVLGGGQLRRRVVRGLIAPWVAAAGHVGPHSFSIRPSTAISKGPDGWPEGSGLRGWTAYVLGRVFAGCERPLGFQIWHGRGAGEAFTAINDFFDNEKTQMGLIQLANRLNWSSEVGNIIADAFRSTCLLYKDAPHTADLPDVTVVAGEAELLMWVWFGRSVQDVTGAELLLPDAGCLGG